MNNRIRYIQQSVTTYAFYQLPKFLFNDEFADLSSDARVLYALLRNRLEISIKNGWCDKNGEVYLYFKREDMQSMLHLSKRSVINAMNDLKEYNLLEETKQGLGRPNKIYLLTISSPSETETSDPATTRVRYTVQSVLNNVFYQLPKFLFCDEFSDLSNDAKILYAILRDRHESSIKKNWHDKNGDVYIYFKREEMQNVLQLSNKPIINAMMKLKSYSLLEETKQGLGKPNKIYLLSVCQEFDPGTDKESSETLGNVQRCKISTSGGGDISVQRCKFDTSRLCVSA